MLQVRNNTHIFMQIACSPLNKFTWHRGELAKLLSADCREDYWAMVPLCELFHKIQSQFKAKMWYGDMNSWL